MISFSCRSIQTKQDIEFKKAENHKPESLETTADRALKQIEQRNYAQVLREKGINESIWYGIAVKDKKIFIKTTKFDI